MVVNLFMEFFESKALSSALFHPNLWKKFVDDICAVWSHGKERLELFLHHLNNQSSSIKFTMD